MSNTYSDLQNSHPCFGGNKNHAGRIHLPVSPGCNIACRFCRRAINDIEDRPGVASKVITPEESLEALEKALNLCPEIKVAGIAGGGHAGNRLCLGGFWPDKEKICGTHQMYEYERAALIRESRGSD